MQDMKKFIPGLLNLHKSMSQYFYVKIIMPGLKPDFFFF